MNSRKKINLPLGLGLSKSGQVGWQSQGQMTVGKPGKAPKRRFEPRQFIWVENQLWEIVYAFRVMNAPSEWLYCLEERKELRSIQQGDKVGHALASMGAGSHTPRVSYDLFHSEMNASMFFSDIPANSNRATFSNQKLLQGKAEIRSSGEVLEPEGLVKSK